MNKNEQEEQQQTEFAPQGLAGNRSKKSDTFLDQFTSEKAFYEEMRKQLLCEMYYLRENGTKRQKLFDGILIEDKNEHFLYSFESETELGLPANTQLSLWLQNSSEPISAVAVDCAEFTIVLEVEKFLGRELRVIEFSAETWRLLQSLIDRLEKVCEEPSPLVKELICSGKNKILSQGKITKGQGNAISMSNTKPITFIWGPPGTGKTETLARIALNHINMGKSVLMLSYSNVSVDGAILRVFNKDTRKTPGKLVRYGYPKNKEILKHEYLNSYNLALRNHPDLRKEYEDLIEFRNNLSRKSVHYVEAGKRLEEIRAELLQEERTAVQNASFVATTVSKAVMDATLYGNKFDTVIFDEASMAYIPQIVFSASLAKEHFICMGDFAQLPPIVQSEKAYALNEDIFRYCGIVSAVEKGCGHEWLCLLNTQYRMHPKIAAFSSQTMYHDLLESGPGMKEKRDKIAAVSPLPHKPLAMVDLSDMHSACTKTADHSRINVLSGMISMALAVKIAHSHDVGIITPYNAQSRLLHAMSRDIAEIHSCRHKITCATVHQFQGSEQDVILYDAVDCYLMPYPGMLLTSMENDYANRLYNVALTRARGKMVSLANVKYMRTKSLSKKLIFRKMIEDLSEDSTCLKGNRVIQEIDGDVITSFNPEKGNAEFLSDLSKARSEIRIDIPGGTSGQAQWFEQLAETLTNVKRRGVKVYIRAENKKMVPEILHPFTVENKFVANPVTLIDKYIVWYGEPLSDAAFITEEKTIQTLYKPILRFKGTYFSQALYGFLEMNKTIDGIGKADTKEQPNHYDTFASYVAGEIKCAECGSGMRLRKKSGKYFLACSAYPQCKHTQFVTTLMLDKYFFFNNPKGKLCPQDHASLEARNGRYGVYVCCCSRQPHKYNLDDI